MNADQFWGEKYPIVCLQVNERCPKTTLLSDHFSERFPLFFHQISNWTADQGPPLLKTTFAQILEVFKQGLHSKY